MAPVMLKNAIFPVESAFSVTGQGAKGCGAFVGWGKLSRL